MDQEMERDWSEQVEANEHWPRNAEKGRSRRKRLRQPVAGAKKVNLVGAMEGSLETA